jgi:flagellar P-ring protein precursor FlgI
MEVPLGPRVVINERAGSIVMSGDVEVGPVVITHKNMVIQAGGAQFVGLDSGQSQTTKLKALIDALNALNTPTQDVIQIIKSLEKNGKLRGRLIIE